MTRMRLGGLIAVAIGPLGWCLALGAVVGGDPMLAIEVTGGVLALVWASLVIRNLAESRRDARALAADADPAEIFGVPCHVTSALGADAVVVGALRPEIYVGRAMLSALSTDELRAVLYHEDHHRRTLAPLRAAALGAWLRLLGRSAVVRGHILDRLTDLETLADADAIRRGSTARSLARALIKGDASPQPASFAYAAERRVGQLLARADGAAVDAAGRLPYEWLPVLLLGVATLGCHAGL